MNSPELLSDLLNRQRAQWLFAAGLALILCRMVAEVLWPSLPAPAIVAWFPVAAAAVLSLGIWLYPRRGLSLRRQTANFRMRTEALLLLLLSPFMTWIGMFPHCHHLLISATLCVLMTAALITEFARFMADGARSGARSRLLANYIFYSSFLVLLCPTAVLVVMTIIDPAYDLRSVLQKLPPSVSLLGHLLFWHPVVLLIALLTLWRPERDVDLALPRPKGNDE